MIMPSAAELVGPVLLDGVELASADDRVIDPLLKDVRFVPLVRDRAIGKAAYHLGVAAGDSKRGGTNGCRLADGGGRATVEGGRRDAAGGGDGEYAVRGKKAKKSGGRKT